jgi:enoyl-CoA hydratase/carnithine racemase
MTLASKPAFNQIAVDLQPPIVRVTLNNPPLNVIDLEMMGELLATLEQAETIAEVSTIIFAGSERAFSSGVDIAAHTPENVRNMLTAFHGVIKAVAATRKLTIASVRRHCLGGGAELALLCDVVYATPDSVWGFPEIKLGLLSARGGCGSGVDCWSKAGGRDGSHRTHDYGRRSTGSRSCEWCGR